MAHGRRQLLRRLGALGATPLVAGCLGDDGGGGTTGTTDGGGGGGGGPYGDGGGTTTGGTATPVGAQEKFPDYNWGKLEGVAATPTSTITMESTAFEPLVAAMPPGTELTVRNEDPGSHTMTVPALGIKETLTADASTTVTVEEEGTFDYVCEFHPPGMLGRLVVSEDAGGGTPTDTATATPTDTPTPSPTPAGAVVKLVGGNAYDPVRLSVDVGETVTWVNTESGYYANHTVTAAQFHDVAESWEFNVGLEAEETASYTFDSAGVYEYYCTVHGKSVMCGAILVGGATLEKDLPCE